MNMALPLRVRAVNTVADSENKIHHDTVAAEYGFRGGLVPGVTVYGYTAAAAIEHFGPEWLDRGAMDVRFLKPVYEGDEIVVTLEAGDDGRVRIDTGGSASADAWMHSDAPGDPMNHTDASVERRGASRETLAPGIHLGTLVRRLDLSQSRISAPLDPFIGPERRAHPAILLSLANEILMSNYELGPWMHTASAVRNFSSARDGEQIRVQACIEDQFERKGHEFVVLDMVMLGEDRVIEQVRHTAIWRPRKS
jgi:MaoC like domain